MYTDGKIWLGQSADKNIYLLPQMANRHGLISGATGTGKTITMKVLAESFSAMGVPVFFSDVKGDLSGMCRPGADSDSMRARIASFGIDNFPYTAYPTRFWDIFGEQGHPVRITVSSMGPTLLARLLKLTDIQAGVLNIVFRVADDHGLLLLDLKDLRAMLQYTGENRAEFTTMYGNVSAASIGAIQRALLAFEDEGGASVFGEPALDIRDWMRTDVNGRGYINILSSTKLIQSPNVYATFLLWMLSELFERLPEVGDLEKPRMVFFFDEAHLLFGSCSKMLLEKVEQVVRLIRSKGVGVYFITQSPADIPMSILGQLGNRVQHALRAYTPLDQKAVKVAAQTFRTNPAFDTEEAITQLKTGEALVSFLDETGAPGVVSRATILPPQSYMSAIDAQLRRTFIETSPLYGVYDEPVDRQSAYEMLVSSFRREQVQPAAPVLQPAQVQVSTAQPVMSRPQGFMVYDPATGGYVQKQLSGMTPLPQVPTLQVEQPAQPQVQQMPVMVFDAASGQYVQRMMAMQLDPVTGNYVAVQPQQAAPVDARAAERAEKEAEKQRKAEEKAEKERIAEERRRRADELREERAERARRNDSLLGRVKNTAISTASREVTRQLTRGLLGSFSGLFGGKK